MASKDARVALVTGAAQGIGRGIAADLLARGWLVVLADVKAAEGNDAVDTLAPDGGALFVEIDVSDESSVEAGLETVRSQFGRLDALVNNAGIADPENGPLEQLSLEEWNKRLGTNLTGAFLMSKHAVPLLRESRGSIVNMASTRAAQSEPHTEAYAASKGGLVALTHAMAVSFGPEIRVNAVSPGWIDTRSEAEQDQDPLRPIDHRQHAAGRVGRPQDVASLVAFLIGEESGFVTGQNYVIDGGISRQMIYAE
ncbi:NAD(P)-dependent dehydrogenase, short-chain alcohol dehydrogenase family [Halopseudomonas xinjiangensis]|uniref:NAD(P)-dependent dehydrogenase, short-chain alcohol dehydrogenase family n=1 Tax=Halopseudomonas xinjiangensis TaxID=487184 RepID=A0A1H1PQR6_9GAMM|nr:SDR family oxidoreductase [Halopseudomonas xinjiangensis]SDS13661.1 NAD(P)-dependent dehydrogenase, short-chain alcohol dehydrogenase family [Halopseudomonas xinjiangensis]